MKKMKKTSGLRPHKIPGPTAVRGGGSGLWGKLQFMGHCRLSYREAFMRDTEEYESLEEYERAFE